MAIVGILWTDAQRHPETVNALQSFGAALSRRGGCHDDAPPLSPPSLSATDVAAWVIHAADLSAQLCPDFSVAYDWSERCYAEFTAQVRWAESSHLVISCVLVHPLLPTQAAVEAAAGLPSAAYMNDLTKRADRARQQLVFLDYVVTPLWAAVSVAFPEAAGLAVALLANRRSYAAISDEGSAQNSSSSDSSDAAPPKRVD